MSKHADGGPAFPTPWAAGTATEGGMTMRDWFAGQALAGMAAFSGTPGVSYGLVDIARRSYEVADFMLKERKK